MGQVVSTLLSIEPARALKASPKRLIIVDLAMPCRLGSSRVETARTAPQSRQDSFFLFKMALVVAKVGILLLRCCRLHLFI